MVFIKDGTDTSRQLPERAVYKGITDSWTSRHISRLTSRQTSRYYMLNLSPHRVGGFDGCMFMHSRMGRGKLMVCRK